MIMKKMNLLLILSILIMSIITTICNHGGLLNGILFTLFEVCCIIVPGIVFMLFLRIKKITKIEMLAFTYFGGYIFSILVYSIVMFLGVDKWIREIYVGIFLLSIAIIFLCKKNILEKYLIDVTRSEVMIAFMTIFSIFLIKLLTFSLSETPSQTTSYIVFIRDFLHWAGDVVSCKMSVPPDNIRTLSGNYNYHYLGALQIALISKFMGTSAVSTTALFSYIQPTIMLSLVSCSLVFRLINNIHIRIITLLLLFLSNGFENTEIVITYRWHVFIQPMTFDIGYAFFMAVVLVIIIQLQQNELNKGLLVFNTLLIGNATGIKGPCGMMAVVLVGIICLYWLLHKKISISLSYGVLTLTSFFIIYISMLAQGSQNYATTLPDLNYTSKTLLGLLKYYVMLNPVTMILAGGFVIYLFIKKKITIQHWSFGLVLLIGGGLGYFLSMNGSSEMYFPTTTLCLAAFLTGQMFDIIMSSMQNNCYRIILYGLCIIVMISSSFIDFQKCFNGYIALGVKTILQGKNNIELKGGTVTIVSRGEYLAYDWIRENTESDKIFLSERVLVNPLDTSVIPALAERKAFYYGNDENLKEIVNRAYSGDEKALAELFDMGIEYVIVHKMMSPHFKWPEGNGNVIFDNNEVIVYQVLH